MRKRNAIAAIVVSGIMVGGAGVAVGSEVTGGSAGRQQSAEVRTDRTTAVGTRAGSKLAISNVAAATDAVVRKMGDGRVTQVAFTQEGGRSLWKVTIDQGKGPDPMDAMYGKEAMDRIRAGRTA